MEECILSSILCRSHHWICFFEVLVIKLSCFFKNSAFTILLWLLEHDVIYMYAQLARVILWLESISQYHRWIMSNIGSFSPRAPSAIDFLIFLHQNIGKQTEEKKTCCLSVCLDSCPNYFGGAPALDLGATAQSAQR